ncbi:unnamed protein product [Trichogramma brassicae]|uniref:Uncharacterized protein n=1 Tax=Trichogramma brassicae TaxID=86971 RepID=A0A6H5I1J1_9HYME|nr:unnamed protein product [Trichogramma brassicae]
MDLLQNFFGVSWYPILKLPVLKGASRRRHNQCGLVLHFPATPSMCTCCVRGPAGLAPHTQSIFYSMYACHIFRSRFQNSRCSSLTILPRDNVYIAMLVSRCCFYTGVPRLCGVAPDEESASRGQSVTNLIASVEKTLITRRFSERSSPSSASYLLFL